MAKIGAERVLSVHHWNDSLFSFTATRDPGLRFENGHFVMVGLEVDGKRVMRAYSMQARITMSSSSSSASKWRMGR
jgi:ferredoxin--NADP+ reductase